MHCTKRFAGVVLFSSFVLAAGTSAQTEIVPWGGTPLDITPWGTAITGVTDDSVHTITTTVGNALFPAGTVRIGTNGFALSGSATASCGFSNYDVPSYGLPNNVSAGAYAYVMPYWDDLDPIGLTSGSTTIYWYEDPSGNSLTIQWNNIGHFADVAGQTITFQMIVWDSEINDCGTTSWISFYYLDASFGGSQATLDYGLSATIGYVAGAGNPFGNAKWSFDNGTVFNGTHLQVLPNEFLLTASSPTPNTLKLDLTGGPCNGGTYVLAVTTTQGIFPDGWLHGLDIPFSQLVAQVNAGFPFVGPLNPGPTGSEFSIGPFPGMPSGFQFWAVALGWPSSGTGAPTRNTLPITYVIP